MAQAPTPSFCKAGLCDSSCKNCHPRELPPLSASPRRDRFTETTRNKKLGKWLIIYKRKGVGGIVPNHAPHERKVIISQGKRGWHLHLTLTTLRTWNGLRTADLQVALHPSERRRERLQAQAVEQR